jgi:two-component system nitrogen regulation sensor histidine kinase NtrY
VLFWVSAFILSLSGMFYLGLNPELINTDWPWVLFVYNLIISFFASLFLFYTIKRLKSNQKKNVLGSKFTWSFIKIVPVLTLVPVMSFYLFSFQSIQDTLFKLDNRWDSFNKRVVNSVNIVHDSVANYVSSIYADVTKANFLAIEGFIKYQIDSQKKAKQDDAIKEVVIDLKPILNSLVSSSLACQLQLYDSNNNLLAESKKDENCIPYKDVGDEIDKNQPYLYYSYKNKTATDKNLIQTIVSTRYFTRSPVTDYFVLSSVYQVSDSTSNSLISLDDNFEKFKSGNVFKFSSDNPLMRKRFLVDFSTTILLTILAVLVIVIRMINKLMSPLHNLSKATQQIAKGNYDVEVKNDGVDNDLSLLIKYFNEMSNQIRLSREGLDTHNVYLETILQYSYGVIALDSKKRIQFLNPIVEDMLGLDKNQNLFGISYKELAKENKKLKILIDLINQNFVHEKWNSDIKITFPEQNKLILCQGTKLRAKSKILGYLIVLNDITELNRAQKKAAWGEVAMKMAHEVKNPLTPILLSADRLRNKFLDNLEGKDLEIMEKTTSTIIEQVKSMSIMVEAFSEFANTPKISKKSQNLNSIINNAVELYDADEEVVISLDLRGSLPDIYLDSESIKRLFINLIKNSKEASTSELINIKIKSELDQTNNRVRVIIDDDGEGFDSNIIDKIFEPYASTKITGSGLGLAIVHNIVEQHNGNIFAKNIKPHGARIVIELPVGN